MQQRVQQQHGAFALGACTQEQVAGQEPTTTMMQPSQLQAYRACVEARAVLVMLNSVLLVGQRQTPAAQTRTKSVTSGVMQLCRRCK
jgi:hypothetical protein